MMKKQDESYETAQFDKMSSVQEISSQMEKTTIMKTLTDRSVFI